MPTDVADMTTRGKHLVVHTESGVHVVPTSTVRRVASGKEPLEALGEPVLRRIIAEWLEAVCRS